MSNLSAEIVAFWQDELSAESWRSPNPETVAKMKSAFAEVQQFAKSGELGAWVCNHESCLALILLLDQYPRMAQPGKPEAFATDGLALAIAKRAIVMGHDLKVPEAMRIYFYLPLMHSESLMDQERCVRLMTLRLPSCRQAQLAHAKAHRDIIRQYGRFPCRNAHLGRASTPAEERYLNAGGYAHVVNSVAA